MTKKNQDDTKKKAHQKKEEPVQNMQRFDKDLAKAIRDDYRSHSKEPLVETIRYMYRALKEMERLMKLPNKLNAKQMYEKLKEV